MFSTELSILSGAAVQTTLKSEEKFRDSIE
jgi:hypothetical protein